MAAKTWAGDLGTSRQDVFFVDPEDVVIVTDPSHPSGCYRRSAHHKPRADLIALFGAMGWIRSSVVVLRKDGDEFIVAAGNDRVISLREYNRLAKLEGKEPLRMLCIREAGGAEQVAGVVVGENEGRRILDPVERAEGWARYLATGKSERDAAKMSGQSLAEFKAMMAVLQVSPSAKAKIKSRDLAPSVATTLARESSELQEKVVASLPPKASVREVQAAVKQEKRSKAGDATPVRVAPKTSIVRRLLRAMERVGAVRLDIEAIDLARWVLADDGLGAEAQKEIDRLLAMQLDSEEAA